MISFVLWTGTLDLLCFVFFFYRYGTFPGFGYLASFAPFLTKIAEQLPLPTGTLTLTFLTIFSGLRDNFFRFLYAYGVVALVSVVAVSFGTSRKREDKL